MLFTGILIATTDGYKRKSLNITTKKKNTYFMLMCSIKKTKIYIFFFYHIDFLIIASPKQELFVKYLRNSSCFMIAS